MSFKLYRKQILEKKRMKKKMSRERQKELVKQKNSSNGSIRNDSYEEKNNISIERSEKTNKLINRIAEMNNKKEKDKDQPATNHISLNINQVQSNLNNEVSQEQIKVDFKMKSPKPPKPKAKKQQNETVNSLSNSVNLSQLIRDTQPMGGNQSKKRILMESKPKSEQRKIDVVERKQPIKIDVKKIKFKKSIQGRKNLLSDSESANAPVIKLKNLSIKK